MNGLMVGFIGFGEAGSHFAKGLLQSGVGRIFAYDINTHSAKLGPRIQERARESGTVLVDSSQEIARECDFLISTVTADAAQQAAVQTAPHLETRHFYADFNSVSPGTKQNIARVVSDTGAQFVEGAIMSPVPPHGHRAPILLGGPGSVSFAERLTPFGMRLEVIGAEVGTAAATKMFRSIVIKGLEALLFECVLGASAYNAEQRVFASIRENYPGIDWDQLASYMVNRVVVHGERRAREMEEVAGTLREIGVDPFMAEATVKRMDWSAQLDLRSRFGSAGPAHYREVVQAVQERSEQHAPEELTPAK